MGSQAPSVSDILSRGPQFPHEFRIPCDKEHIRKINDPHFPDSIQHYYCFVKVKDFQAGIPDDINPRGHEILKGPVPAAIIDSIQRKPKWLHIYSRGCLIIVSHAAYDANAKMMRFTIQSEKENGLGDGGTLEAVLNNLKASVSQADFSALKKEEIPEYLWEAYIKLEIIVGDLGEELVDLTRARNTSKQVEEFSLENLGGGFDWLKDVIENSELRNRVAYRAGTENRPVDIKDVLGAMTLFHPKWNEKDDDAPVVAYSGKGRIIDVYRNEDWLDGYKAMSPVLIDILKLHDHVLRTFGDQYNNAKGGNGVLGLRKEATGKKMLLPMTGIRAEYQGIPNGWLYPILAALRPLLGTKNGVMRWAIDPFKFWDANGHRLVQIVVSREDNPNKIGKDKDLWVQLCDKTESIVIKNSNKR